MIRGGGIVGAFFLLIILYGLAVLGAGLCVVGLLLFIRRSNRIGFLFLVVGSLLIGPILAVIHKSSEIKKTQYLIETTIPLETKGYSMHPKAYRDELGGYLRQMVWGEINLNVELPNGGSIRGSSDRMSMNSSPDGKFHSLQVFYEPDMAFCHATAPEDVFKYWKKQGTVIWDFPGSVRIDCGDYILKIGEIGGYVSLTATTEKES